MATANDTRTNRRRNPFADTFRKRLGIAGVAAAAAISLGAGASMAGTHSSPAPGSVTAATRTVAGIPIKVGVQTATGPTAPVIHAAPVAPAPTPVTAKPVTPKPTAAKPTTPKPGAKPVTPKPTAAKPAPKAAPKPAAPSRAQLMPHGTPSGQVSFTPTRKQLANAATIVATGQKMHLPPRAYVMAVACSLQESRLSNLGNLGASNDHDSLGLFQQRPSSGWGSPSQILNPAYAAHKFYAALKQVPGFTHLPLTTAVQKVQVSAFPQAYAKWEKMAANLVAGTYQH